MPKNIKMNNIKNTAPLDTMDIFSKLEMLSTIESIKSTLILAQYQENTPT